ncbi:response regulator [Leptolyngbya cf. ectocarpi LEGE 11479]|uniref:Response regulator n=1 Tax=Leptolyngbya cf. ectocarpi LEGE 11479 TaxID=1828722 RepID=A0A929F9L4_LEPEC|nr:response regulator [Leptolyngbya ectocarpi]MBE9069441.1 response regulator [Leptolyngbya cf. ectocarpi LEGE 11479]
MNTISPLNAVQVCTKRKPRLLVVDDEPDNLDLLYRTFRREYQVLRAESGRKALEVLEDDGEVAVIISDQRMPEMTGTEFLSKTVPDFPDTVRIILTGFTDVEDLVQAINNGQVYRYITKPWEPDTLRQLVKQATQTYGLLKQSNHALYIAECQNQLMSRVAELSHVTLSPQDALQFIADGWGQTLSAKLCAIKCLEETSDITAVFGNLCGRSLDHNPLVQHAIATRMIQTIPDTLHPNFTEPHQSLQDDLYTATDTQAHLVAPVLFHDRLLAVVSLHWSQSYRTLDDVSSILTIAIDQMAQALIALRC